MKIPTYIVAAIAGLAALSICGCQAKVEYLKEEPPDFSVPYGKILYVDDGRCPSGEVTEITGGNQRESILRKRRCVKRPD